MSQSLGIRLLGFSDEEESVSQNELLTGICIILHGKMWKAFLAPGFG